MASNSVFVQYIVDVDDRNNLSMFVRETCKAQTETKPKKKR